MNKIIYSSKYFLLFIIIFLLFANLYNNISPDMKHNIKIKILKKLEV